MTIVSGAWAVQGIAKNVNFYDQPDASSKVAGSYDTEMGVIPIFTPKDSLWTKVADPRNGNVGWVKSTELGNTKVSYHVIRNNEGTHGYQYIHYGNTTSPSPDAISTEMKQMQLKHQAFQQDMHKMMLSMFKEMDHPWPFIMPVVVVPEKVSTLKQEKSPATAQVHKNK